MTERHARYRTSASWCFWLCNARESRGAGAERLALFKFLYLATISSTSLFFIRSCSKHTSKFFLSLHWRTFEPRGISRQASRKGCSSFCNHTSWHLLWCSDYRHCICELVQTAGSLTVVLPKVGHSKLFSIYGTICHIANQFILSCLGDPVPSELAYFKDLSLSFAFSPVAYKDTDSTAVND